MIASSVWCDGLPHVVGVLPRKSVAIATARMLTECPESKDDPRTFGPALAALLLMLLADQGMASPTDGPIDLAEEDAIIGLDESGIDGYTGAYNQLSFASNPEVGCSYAALLARARVHTHATNARAPAHRHPSSRWTFTPPKPLLGSPQRHSLD